jgi:DNA-binding SARP family transcriptional activator
VAAVVKRSGTRRATLQAGAIRARPGVRLSALPTSSGAAAPAVRLCLLGGFRVEIGGHATEAPAGVQRLLAFLALRPQALQRRYAAGFLWLDVQDERAAANLRSALWRVRQLGAPLVVARGSMIGLHPQVSVDVREAADAGRRWLADGRTPAELDAGVALFESDLLPDWYEEWVAAERERFRQLRLHVLETISERYVALGRLNDALMAAMAAVVADPLRETAHRALIRVHLAEGNTGEAVRQMRLCERLLREELGVVPSASLAELLPQAAR